MSTTLTVSTNVSPPVTLDPSRRGVGGKLLGMIQPTVHGNINGVPFTFAPWGEAVEGMGSFVVYGLAGLAVFGAFTILRRFFK